MLIVKQQRMWRIGSGRDVKVEVGKGPKPGVRHGGVGRGHVLDTAAQSQGPHHVQGLGCLGGDREGAP